MLKPPQVIPFTLNYILQTLLAFCGWDSTQFQNQFGYVLSKTTSLLKTKVKVTVGSTNKNTLKKLRNDNNSIHNSWL